MTWAGIIILTGSFLLPLLWLAHWQWRKHYRQSIMNLDSSSSSSKKQGSWWYKNRYTATIPPANPHSGQQVQPKIFATEHPRTVFTGHLDQAFPYSKRQQFLSSRELTLLKTIEKIFQPHSYRVFCKVGLVEVLDLSMELPLEEQRIALERLRRQCLDFVICQADSGEIVGVITLDQDSEQKPLDSRLHERFVDVALSAVGISSVHLTTTAEEQIATLQQTLQDSLKLPPQATKTATAVGTCPKCGRPLKRVKVTKGPSAGKLLRACSHYPHCKTLLPP